MNKRGMKEMKKLFFIYYLKNIFISLDCHTLFSPWHDTHIIKKISV